MLRQPEEELALAQEQVRLRKEERQRLEEQLRRADEDLRRNKEEHQRHKEECLRLCRERDSLNEHIRRLELQQYKKKRKKLSNRLTAAYLRALRAEASLL